MFKFNPEKVWADNVEADPLPEPSTSRTLAPTSTRKRKLEQKSNNNKDIYIPTSLDAVDSEEEDGHVPFAVIANDSDYLLS